MADNTLPSSLNQDHIKVYEDIYAQKLSEIDISVIMTYIIDLAPENVLYYLAGQWDVLGAKGWRFADTLQKKRDLVRNAIRLNKIIGTPRAIIDALNALGFPDVTVQEHLVGAIYDGTYTYNGAINYNQGYHWAYFRVIIGVNNLLSLTGQMYLDIREIVEVWKNLRSWLEGLYMLADGEEQAAMIDELNLTVGGSHVFSPEFSPVFA